MKHLEETEFIDILEGTLPPGRTAHVESCTMCRSQLDSLRTAMASLDEDPRHEPSPLFWDHFAGGVRARIDDAGRARWFFSPARIATAAAGVAILGVLSFYALRPALPSVAPPRVEHAGAAADAPLWPAEDLDADAEWAVVRAAADDLDPDEAEAEGLAPRAGTLERAAMELSAEERAELVRLVEEELRRTGA